MDPDIDNNDAITITIDDDDLDLPEGAELAKPDSAEKPAAGTEISTDPEDGIEHLKQQLARRDSELNQEREARQRAEQQRVDAERLVRETAGKAEQYRTQASEAGYDSVVNALGAATAELDGLTSRQTEAYEKADFATVAKINAEMGKVSARIERLEDGKVQMDQRRAANPNPAQPAQQIQETAQQFNSRPWNQQEFERFIGSRTPRSAQWVRSHPEFASDPLFRTRVMGADGYVADTLGVTRDTDDYFARIEEAIGGSRANDSSTRASETSHRQQDDANPQPRAAAAPAQRAAIPAATPSRSIPTTRGNMSGRQITLSAEEKKTAYLIMPPKIKDTDPDPLVLYAKYKADLIRDGQMSPDGKILQR